MEFAAWPPFVAVYELAMMTFTVVLSVVVQVGIAVALYRAHRQVEEQWLRIVLIVMAAVFSTGAFMVGLGLALNVFWPGWPGW